MTDEIRVRWSEGERTFGPDVTFTIGRDPGCDIVLENPRVSRQHAELRHTSDGWMFRDPSSTRGSFIGSSRIGEQLLDRTVTVTLGGGTDGESVDFIVPERTRFAAPPPPTTGSGLAAGPPPTPPPPVVDAPPAPQGNGAGSGGAERPGGSLREEPLSPTVVTGQSINIQCAGRSYTFQPGNEVVIGRDPASDIPVDNPVVSRRHAAIRSTGSGWELADYGSSSGTFVDGERITTTKLSGSMAVHLGPEDVGERLVIVTSGPNVAGKRRSRSRTGRSGNKLVVAGLILAFIAAAVAVFALVTRDGNGGGPDFAKVREATVEIETPDGRGSGAIISDDGLILTNAHVVAPDALGAGVFDGITNAELDGPPARIQINVLSGGTVEPAYVGRVVAADGYLDLAVVRITETTGGSIVQPGDDLDLETVDIGDSQDLEAGDDLFVVGYPGIAATNDATVSDGTVGSFLADRRLNDNQAWINTDASIAPGNSGGVAVGTNGRLIGTPSRLRSDTQSNAAVGRIRPIHLAEPLIEAAENESTYTSPFVRPRGEANLVSERLPFVAFDGDSSAFALGCERSEQVATPGAGRSRFAVQFEYEKFPVDAHQDILVRVEQGATVVGEWTSADQYAFPWGSGSGCAVLNIELSRPLAARETTVTFYGGGNYETIDAYGFVAE